MISTSMAQYRVNTIRKFGTGWTLYYDYPSHAQSAEARQVGQKKNDEGAEHKPLPLLDVALALHRGEHLRELRPDMGLLGRTADPTLRPGLPFLPRDRPPLLRRDTLMVRPWRRSPMDRLLLPSVPPDPPSAQAMCAGKGSRRQQRHYAEEGYCSRPKMDRRTEDNSCHRRG